MNLGLDKMWNQIRRLWEDDGRNDKDFTPEELKLKQALDDLRTAANALSRASTALLDLLHGKA
jgi:hypothetical protein